jgi:hypothetical protein
MPNLFQCILAQASLFAILGNFGHWTCKRNLIGPFNPASQLRQQLAFLFPNLIIQ